MALLTRGAILSADDLKAELVEVPEWGGEVRVRTLTGNERDAYIGDLFINGKVSRVEQTAKFLARCIVDEAGKAIFSEDDVTALGAKSTTALQRVQVVADRLNAIGEAAVEEAVKN